MKQFEHGGKIYQAARDLAVSASSIVDFSANINPLVTTAQLQSWAGDSWTDLMHYPDDDYYQTRLRLADKHAVDEQQIVIGNGAASLIDMICRVLAPRRALITAPSFGEYERALNKVASQLTIVNLEPDYTLAAHAFIRAATQVELAFLCSPNNPTGRLVARHQLLAILDALPEHVTLIVDEAFIDFTADGEANSLAQLIERYSNLVILRSATKFYGIPGLRFGYLMSSNLALLTRLKASQPAWPVNSMACRIVENALLDEAFAARTRAYIARARQTLTAQLRALGITVFASDANYLLIKETRQPLYEALYHRAILIRRCANYRGLDATTYRIAVKSEQDNAHLIAQLNEILRG